MQNSPENFKLLTENKPQRKGGIRTTLLAALTGITTLVATVPETVDYVVNSVPTIAQIPAIENGLRLFESNSVTLAMISGLITLTSYVFWRRSNLPHKA